MKEQEEEAETKRKVVRIARDALRKEMAQQLLTTCGGILNDERSALKALEIHRDDVDAAVNWLLDNPAAVGEITRALKEEDVIKKKKKEKEKKKKQKTAQIQ